MRIERVVAHAFGPFRGEALGLASGMTVVAGPNEAGKSSWHAAVRAALCGVRRARGRATTSDAQFERRHRPWDGDGSWLVEARLTLDEGRTIEMVQDLGGKVACRATDVGLGRDVSSEIIVDGTPDASVWLGLDRDAFAATLSVSQAQITAIAERDTAAALQEHMQRAAATRGTDATAAEARERIAAFRREHVGVDRAGARGPLRGSLARQARATEGLAEARRQHAEFLSAGMDAEASLRIADEVARRVALAEAAVARRAAEGAQRRAMRAAELAERHPVAPAGSAERDERADQVARAIEAWRRRPKIAPLGGTASTELVGQLARLPDPPVGDQVVHESVAGTRRALDVASEAVRLHQPRPLVDAAALQGPDEVSLRNLARRLRTPEPEDARLLEAEADAARRALQAVASGPGPISPRMFAVAAAVATVGVGLAVLGQPVVGLALVAIGLAVVVLSWQRGATRAGAAADRIARAEAALAPTRAAQAFAEGERSAARAEAEAAGLPAEAELLDQLADRRAATDRAMAAQEAWKRQQAELEARRQAADAALRAAVAARDPTVSGDSSEALLAGYEAACRRRAEQAQRAGQRGALLEALHARRAAESQAAQAAAASAAAETALREAAVVAGTAREGSTPEQIIDGLAAWQAARVAELRSAEVAVAEWQELMALLDGATFDDLRLESEERTRRAAELEAALGRSAVRALAGREDLETLLAVERENLFQARRDADSRAGALEQMRLDLPDVAEAEEALAEAESERARVVGLAEVLDETQALLRAAEELVHRDLAPVLAAALRRRVASVSGGRYVDASVDPADLAVRVKEAATGQWRSALLLSEGTREQIYLLLRVAMAQHLVTSGETAPLLLDEVTAQADPERTQRLLDVLHEISAERQVILFSHDPAVVAWAERTFDSGRDVLVRLGTDARVGMEARVLA